MWGYTMRLWQGTNMVEVTAPNCIVKENFIFIYEKYLSLSYSFFITGIFE
jgi:hypothetical protein